MSTRNQQLNPKTSEKTPPKKAKLRRWRYFLQHLDLLVLFGTVFWRRWWFGKTGESEILHYSLFFLSCLVISPPKWSHLGQDGGNNMDLHLDTPQWPRIMVIPHVEMERDRQQESACGFCHYWGGFYHYWHGFYRYWGFFLYF